MASLLDMEMASTTVNNLYRDFNTSAASTTELNTPEIRNDGSISNFDECFSNLLHESLKETDDIEFIIDQGNNGILMENTLCNAPYNDMSSSMPPMEEVWASESFENENLGPCISAAEVEGVSISPENVNNSIMIKKNS